MVRIRRITPLQQPVNNDAQWERLLQKEGLTVVDIYSEWCGPCAAMIPHLKKLKREVGMHKLHFAIAKSDNVTYLESFRDRSEPTWMFIVEGKIINAMYGANAPKLVRLIVDELKKESAVKAGVRERGELEITNFSPKQPIEDETVKETPKIEEKRSVNVFEDDFIYRPF